MDTQTISSVGELSDAVGALVTETNWKWWFRGHPDADWALQPSVRRNLTPRQERYLTNEFRPRAAMRYPNPPSASDYAGWLALMQHYGLPTRLLDWSRSPLVAGYFATESCQKHQTGEPVADACIWAIAPGELNIVAGLQPVLYPLGAATLRQFLKPAIKERVETQKVPIAAVPAETDLRMVIQQGAFTIHPSSAVGLSEVQGASRFLRRFLIPAARQKAFARELDVLGLRLGDLFPDLANLAVELKGQHKPYGE